MNGSGFGVLSLCTFFPLVGALLIAVQNREAKNNARWIALYTTLFTLGVAVWIWAHFDPTTPAFQFKEEMSWLDGTIKYKMGVDGISMLFVVLTAFLMPFCIIASWGSIQNRVKEYLIAFLILESLMIGVFCALDLVLFYLFFEGGLIPMFLIIGVWGGERRVYASFKFFLYTLAGSVLMLLALMAMYWHAGTTDIETLLTHKFPAGMQWWLWLAFFASFAVKLPMWPVHTWLPDAHVEAPTAGSVVLAGILLKMGGYGFLRFSLPMFPLASQELAPFVFALSIVAIIYTSLVALAQEDMKKLIAYSSVAHMGFVTMGIFSFTVQGVDGAIFQMLSHGLVSAALFLCVGVIYDRMHTRRIDAYGGLVNRMPLYAAVFMVFTMANVGLPGTSGFVGEFLTMLGAFKAQTWVAFLAAFGVILSAAYALYLYRRVIFGPLEKPSLKAIVDLNYREILVFTPLVLLVLLFGFYPAPLLDVTAVSVKKLVTNYEAALQAAQALNTQPLITR
ncbi:MAG TPA: NADH-quinone oxidoreductase subunit M [Hyphomicrobiaceae bacterium]|nr:NADH-quinone oxidoreductase subunit M [Hyphomicrobiaceae bacterium]